MNFRFMSLLPLAFQLMSCSNDNFLKSSNLIGLRIIGIIADQPEVSPGATVTLTPIVSDYNGGGRAISYQYQLCGDPGISYGAAPSCTGQTIVSSSSGTLAGLSAPNYVGPTSAISLSLPDAATVFANRSSIDQFNGVDLLFVMTVSAGKESLTAFRRISVTTKTVVNQNPVIADILSVGVSVTTLPATKVSISPSLASQPEVFETMSIDGVVKSQTETLIVSWYSTGGILKYVRTLSDSANEWDPPTAQTDGRSQVLIAIVRDARGGLGYLIREL
ncbi:MAG: hypothetical protein COT74_03475 [Bdellovibrionales bacterium CG10_big_fil_rev_8_21_14_0_10_45_34]|nr:MAG: hypothetical protein COT74_03475 [Bdellovibrionales bacterium CG10_big_fil_rev_8_21_14_0_10_45_34]